MAGMFNGCSRLTSINLYNFNTKNVQSMEQMFYNCDNLKYLDISYFSTSFTPNILNDFAWYGTIITNRNFYEKIKSQVGMTWTIKFID